MVTSGRVWKRRRGSRDGDGPSSTYRPRPVPNVASRTSRLLCTTRAPRRLVCQREHGAPRRASYVLRRCVSMRRGGETTATPRATCGAEATAPTSCPAGWAATASLGTGAVFACDMRSEARRSLRTSAARRAAPAVRTRGCTSHSRSRFPLPASRTLLGSRRTGRARVVASAWTRGRYRGADGERRAWRRCPAAGGPGGRAVGGITRTRCSTLHSRRDGAGQSRRPCPRPSPMRMCTCIGMGMCMGMGIGIGRARAAEAPQV